MTAARAVLCALLLLAAAAAASARLTGARDSLSCTARALLPDPRPPLPDAPASSTACNASASMIAAAREDFHACYGIFFKWDPQAAKEIIYGGYPSTRRSLCHCVRSVFWHRSLLACERSAGARRRTLQSRLAHTCGQLLWLLARRLAVNCYDPAGQADAARCIEGYLDKARDDDKAFQEMGSADLYEVCGRLMGKKCVQTWQEELYAFEPCECAGKRCFDVQPLFKGSEWCRAFGVGVAPDIGVPEFDFKSSTPAEDTEGGSS